MISQFNTASPSRKASLTHAKRYVRHITSLFSRYTSFCCLLFGMLLFFSCGKSSSSDSIPTPTPVAKSTAKVVSSFIFEATENTALDSDVTATVTGTAIAATVPFGTDVTALKPTIVHTGKSIAPLTGVVQDFTSDVKYIVTAEDKSTQAYTVTVTVALSPAKDVTKFTFETADNTLTDAVVGDITDTTIAATVPFGTDVTALKPTIVHTGKSIAPLTGVAQDFTSPATYTVTAEDGTTQDYTVTVTVAKSAAKVVSSFIFEASKNTALDSDVTATVTGTAIAATVPFGTDVTALKPTIVHTGKSIDPLTGVAQDFTSPATYTVMAEDGTTQAYTVTVAEEAGQTTKAISSFVFTATANTALTADVTATVDATAKTIAATVAFGTDVKALKPTIVHNGASIVPNTGVATDFSSPATYTVTAQDGTSQVYTVTVAEEAGQTTKAISSFVFTVVDNTALTTDVTATVNETAKTVAATVPFGTDVKALKPTIMHTGASIAPNTGVATDFTSPVTYTVMAEDGTTQAYTVTVAEEAGQTTKAISSFVFTTADNATFTTDLIAVLDATAKTIATTVPFATDVTALVPTIIHSGASIAPLTAVATDFTSPATYTVTAADGTTQAYTVTVTIAEPYATIPDANFRKYLKEKFPSAFGTRETMDANHADITNFTGTIDVNYEKIASLEGIQYFTKLTVLDCSNNELTELDMSKNIELIDLNCRSNQLTELDLRQNTALTRLNCSSNKLTSLDLRQNTALTRLNCSSNKLTNLDVSKNTALTNLNCGGNSSYPNKLTELDLSKNIELTELDCSANQLTELDVSKNIKLTKLNCGGDSLLSNKLTELDVSQNTALTNLNCFGNQLTELDVSKNTALTELDCGSNQLKVLDVSQNTALTYLDCYENQLTELDVSKNIALTDLDFRLNQLTELDLSKNIALTDLDCAYNELTKFDVSKNIALTNLKCSSNQLTILDVSHNTALTTLDCLRVSLKSLDVSKNLKLTRLDCRFSQLTALDLTGMQSVEQLYIDAGEENNGVITNPLTTLKVNDLIKQEAEIKEAKANRGGNIVITTYKTDGTVVCGTDYNPNTNECANPNKMITSFIFEASRNQGLTSDITATISVFTISAIVPDGTSLSSLIPTIVHSGTISPASLEAQDFTQPVTYTVTQGGNTQEYMVRVDDKEGQKRKEITSFIFEASRNQGLTSDIIATISDTDINIAVPVGIDLTKLKPTIIHSGASVNPASLEAQDFTKPITYTVSAKDYSIQPYTIKILATIPDPNFRKYLKEKFSRAFENRETMDISHFNIINTNLINVKNKNISNLEGIQYFTKLIALYCEDNKLTSLDMSHNTTLTDLRCNDNKLTTLNVSKNTALDVLLCHKNQLTSLDMSKNTALDYLKCDNNKLTTLNVSQNTALTTLYCWKNQLTSLDVTQNIALTDFRCNDNKLTTTLDVSKSTALKILYCYKNQLTELDVTQNTALKSLWCSDNQLTALNLIGVHESISLSIDAGKVVGGVTTNPLTTLKVNIAYKDNDELKEAKANRGANIVISTHKTDGTVVCIDYDPNRGVCATGIDEITSFIFKAEGNNALTMDITASISDTDITATVPFGTDVKALKPTIVHTGKSIAPLTAVATDFTSPATYTVTAQDGTSQAYAVTVTIAERYATIPDENFRKYLKEKFPAAFGTRETMDANHADITNFAGTIDVNRKEIASLEGIQYFTKLTELACSSNRLTKLDVSKNIKLTKLDCGGNSYSPNKLTELDLSKNIELTELDCSSNQLTKLDVSKNIKLTKLDCGGDSILSNQLTELDVSQNTALTYLDCYKNQLTELDVSKNIALTDLDFRLNQLTELDVSKNIALTDLDCAYNELTELDVSKNIALTDLECSGNQFTILDLSKNTALTTLDCLRVSLKSLDVSKNLKLTRLDCRFSQLTALDLTGMQSVEQLYIDAGEENNGVITNPLTTLKVNELIKQEAEIKEAKANRGASIVITTYKTDGTVVCGTDYNPNTNECADPNKMITSFVFEASRNQGLTSDITATISVFTISAIVPDGTSLSSLIPTIVHSGTISPASLEAQDFTQPVTYTVTQGGNTQEYRVKVDDKEGQKIKEITSFIFEASRNQGLTSDITATISDTDINIAVPLGIDLTKLKPTIIHSGASVNPASLEAQDFTKKVTYTVSAKDDSIQPYTIKILATIPDPNFRKYLKEKFSRAFENRDTMYILNGEIAGFGSVMEVKNKNISDLEGIQYFTKLIALYCEDNKLTSLDMSHNTTLTDLRCNDNKLTTLNVSKNTALDVLLCHKNQLTALDVTHNTALTTLYCHENQLTALDVTHNTALTTLYCHENQLTALDVSKNTALTTLYCHKNQLTATLDVTHNTALTVLWCNQNKITVLDVSKNTALTTLSCFTNQLTELDVRQHTDLTTLYCNDNPLGTLDVTQNIKLEQLRCDKNELMELDVTKNTALTYLSCEETKLTALDVTQNTALITLSCNRAELTDLDVSKNLVLEVLYCWNNPLGTLDVTKNIALTALDCENNQLTSLDVSQNTKLTYLSCIYNILTTLDMTGMQSVDDSAAPEYPGLNFKVGEKVEYQGNMVTTNPLTTLKVNVALQDRAEIKQVKTTRGTNIVISTHNTDGTVVCADYNPNTDVCTTP